MHEDAPSREAAPSEEQPRPHLLLTAHDLDFVTPWADRVAMVVDITGTEPVLEIPDPDAAVRNSALQDWIRAVAEVGAEIQGLRAEIGRLYPQPRRDPSD